MKYDMSQMTADAPWQCYFRIGWIFTAWKMLLDRSQQLHHGNMILNLKENA